MTEQKELELQLREAGRVSAIVRGLASAANESATVANALDLVQERMSSVDAGMRLIAFLPVVGRGRAGHPGSRATPGGTRRG